MLSRKPARTKSGRVPSARAACALALLLAVAACGAEEEFELKGALGPGGGGPETNGAASESHDLVSFSGADIIGTVAFDNSFFLHYHPDPNNPSLHVIANIPLERLLADLADDGLMNNITGDDLVILITPILGRPDTPCRFQAALLARDDEYKIEGSGDRTTDSGFDLHQVNLSLGSVPLTQRFYCYELAEPFGAQLSVIAVDDVHQEWRVVHAVLNSISSQ